jgi:hypothetical protein
VTQGVTDQSLTASAPPQGQSVAPAIVRTSCPSAARSRDC